VITLPRNIIFEDTRLHPLQFPLYISYADSPAIPAGHFSRVNKIFSS
jgi:hypothetical protein